MFCPDQPLPIAGTTAEGLTQIAQQVKDAAPYLGEEILISFLGTLGAAAVGIWVAWYTVKRGAEEREVDRKREDVKRADDIKAEEARRTKDWEDERQRRREERRIAVTDALRSAYANYIAALSELSTALYDLSLARAMLESGLSATESLADTGTPVSDRMLDRVSAREAHIREAEQTVAAVIHKATAAQSTIMLLEPDIRRRFFAVTYMFRYKRAKREYERHVVERTETVTTMPLLVSKAIAGLPTNVIALAAELDEHERGVPVTPRLQFPPLEPWMQRDDSETPYYEDIKAQYDSSPAQRTP